MRAESESLPQIARQRSHVGSRAAHNAHVQIEDGRPAGLGKSGPADCFEDIDANRPGVEDHLAPLANQIVGSAAFDFQSAHRAWNLKDVAGQARHGAGELRGVRLPRAPRPHEFALRVLGGRFNPETNRRLVLFGGSRDVAQQLRGAS